MNQSTRGRITLRTGDASDAKKLFALIQARMSAHNEGETAMFSKKPLQGMACASCEKGLTNISA